MTMRIPSHSTIAAYLALFASVSGGSAYAATKLAANSVGSRELKDRSVRTKDLAPAARPVTSRALRDAITQVVTDPVTGLNITVHGERGDKGDAGPAGPQGTQGVPGLEKVTRREAFSAALGSGQDGGAVAKCVPGEQVLGGGGRFEGAGAASITASYPQDDGWLVAATPSQSSSGRVHAFVVCAVVAS